MERMMRRKAASRSSLDRRPSRRIARLALEVGTTAGLHMSGDEKAGGVFPRFGTDIPSAEKDDALIFAVDGFRFKSQEGICGRRFDQASALRSGIGPYRFWKRAEFPC